GDRGGGGLRIDDRISIDVIQQRVDLVGIRDALDQSKRFQEVAFLLCRRSRHGPRLRPVTSHIEFAEVDALGLLGFAGQLPDAEAGRHGDYEDNRRRDENPPAPLSGCLWWPRWPGRGAERTGARTVLR